VAGEQLLALVLEQVHDRAPILAVSSRSRISAPCHNARPHGAP
jgi:hypothetical protein